MSTIIKEGFEVEARLAKQKLEKPKTAKCGNCGTKFAFTSKDVIWSYVDCPKCDDSVDVTWRLHRTQVATVVLAFIAIIVVLIAVASSQHHHESKTTQPEEAQPTK